MAFCDPWIRLEASVGEVGFKEAYRVRVYFD